MLGYDSYCYEGCEYSAKREEYRERRDEVLLAAGHVLKKESSIRGHRSLFSIVSATAIIEASKMDTHADGAPEKEECDA